MPRPINEHEWRQFNAWQFNEGLKDGEAGKINKSYKVNYNYMVGNKIGYKRREENKKFNDFLNNNTDYKTL